MGKEEASTDEGTLSGKRGKSLIRPPRPVVISPSRGNGRGEYLAQPVALSEGTFLRFLSQSGDKSSLRKNLIVGYQRKADVGRDNCCWAWIVCDIG